MFLHSNLKYIYSQLAEGLTIIYPLNEAQSIAKIVLEAIGYSSADIISKGDDVLESEQLDFLASALERLQNNEPVQYVLGVSDFYGLKIKVNPSVLIPRQETEELVDLIIKENTLAHPKILDIGTGSGCIALSLKKFIPNAHVDALDFSNPALDVALQNAKLLSLNVHFHQMDILHEAILPGEYNIIVSNPPYVTEAEKSEILGNVLQHEPHEALFISDQYPLIFYECIIELSRRHLLENGRLYFEINERLGKEINILLRESGFHNIRIIKDLNGKDRFAASLSPVRI